MYQAINTVQKSNDINSLRYIEYAKEQKITKLFYNDFFLQTNIYAALNITNSGDFDILRLRTKNSLHAMINPHIAYFVKDNSLYRIESKRDETIPLTYENIERVKVDKLMENVTLFRIYANKNSYLISYRAKERFAAFQISLPQIPSANNQTNQK
jgi:hypothetical protein